MGRTLSLVCLSGRSLLTQSSFNNIGSRSHIYDQSKGRILAQNICIYPNHQGFNTSTRMVWILQSIR